MQLATRRSAAAIRRAKGHRTGRGAQAARTVNPRTLVVSEASADAPAAGPVGEGLTKVTLKQPVGIVFAQKPAGGPVIVEELLPDGPAAKSGRVAVGDVLRRCSAVVLKSGSSAGQEGYGDFLYDNWERVEFDTAGQEFKTVMSALKSNNPRWGINDVTMWFSRGN